MFANYPSVNEKVYGKLLFGLSPMENEDSLGAEEHFEFIEYVTQVHGI